MLAKVCPAAVQGIEAYPIEVEVNVGWGETNIAIVGLPDVAVKESRDRVSTAMTNSAFHFPMGRTTINLAPADVRKGVIVPKDNAPEAAVVAGLDVIPIQNLREAVGFLEGEVAIAPLKVDLAQLFDYAGDDLVDMADVRGQESVKRALEIGAAGGHNMLPLSHNHRLPNFSSELILVTGLPDDDGLGLPR